MRIFRSVVVAAIGASLLVAGAGAASADTTSSTTTPDTGCNKGTWPPSAQGVPSTWKAGAPGGVYLWHDNAGWHLRVTHANHREVTFTGTVEANEVIHDKAVKNERNDVLTAGRNDKSFHFKFKNYGYVDGVDFRTDCATILHFRFARNDAKLPTGSIYLGRTGHHPANNPFVVQRRDRTDGTTTTTVPAPTTTTPTTTVPPPPAP